MSCRVFCDTSFSFGSWFALRRISWFCWCSDMQIYLVMTRITHSAGFQSHVCGITTTGSPHLSVSGRLTPLVWLPIRRLLAGTTITRSQYPLQATSMEIQGIPTAMKDNSKDWFIIKTKFYLEYVRNSPSCFTNHGFPTPGTTILSRQAKISTEELCPNTITTLTWTINSGWLLVVYLYKVVT